MLSHCLHSNQMKRIHPCSRGLRDNHVTSCKVIGKILEPHIAPVFIELALSDEIIVYFLDVIRSLTATVLYINYIQDH